MNVMILGGAGTIGSECVRDLVRTSDFSEIVIGDADTKRGRQFAATFKDRRVSVKKINVEDENDLVRKIKGFTVVISALPFRYDIHVTRAAVKAGVHGIDVFTTKQQFGLHEAAKRNGVTYIVGCGMSPGLTNVLARKGSEKLERPEEIYIAWASYRCLAPAPGLLYTTLWEFDPDCAERAYFQDGKMHSVPPFAGAETVEFSKQIGRQEVYYVSHPEPMTLPMYIKGLKRVDVKGTWPPETMRLLKVFLDFGFYRDKPVKIHGVRMTPEQFIYDYFLQIPEAKETALWGFSVNVRVVGLKGNQRVRYTYITSHPHMDQWGGKAAYAKNVGIPLSIGAQMLAKGQIKEKGVFAPEGLIEPDAFIEGLAERDINVQEREERV